MKAVKVSRLEDLPVGDYYSCTDPDELHCESPEEAVVDFLVGFIDTDDDMTKVIAKCSPVVVTSYRRAELTEDWIKRRAELAMERLAEDFADESGLADPDGGDNGLGEKAMADVLPMMVEALKKFYSHAVVWHCDDVGEVELNAEQVEAILRKECPDWWEK